MDVDDDQLAEDKQLKVKLPLRMHLRLHSVKVLTGQNISEQVAEALAEYLDDMDGLPDLEPDG
jgi:predicted DNA-binding protein